MLTLSRKIGQSIMIGDDIEVKIVKIDRGYAYIGIEAPRNVPILRAELTTALVPLEGPLDHPATCMCIECIPSPRDVEDSDAELLQ